MENICNLLKLLKKLSLHHCIKNDVGFKFLNQYFELLAGLFSNINNLDVVQEFEPIVQEFEPPVIINNGYFIARPVPRLVGHFIV